MFIKALYEETKEKCWVNDSYVVDIFQNKNNTYTLYTFDNDRGAYIVSKEAFDKWQEQMRGEDHETDN